MSGLSDSQSGPWTADELANAVNDWCDRHDVRPLEGRAADRLTARNLHYYRGVGLITSPGRGRGRSYGERQFLELVAIRLLQARGLPHKRIQELLFGRSLDDLRKIRDTGLAELAPSPLSLCESRVAPAKAEQSRPAAESWKVADLDGRHLLMTRTGRAPTLHQLKWIRRILKTPSARLEELQFAPE